MEHHPIRVTPFHLAGALFLLAGLLFAPILVILALIARKCLNPSTD